MSLLSKNPASGDTVSAALYANAAAFPANGYPGSLAVALDTYILYVLNATTGLWTAIGPSVDAGITQLTGDVTAGPGSGSQVASISSTTVTGKLLTGYVSGAGTVAASDTILQALQKLNGNDALRLLLAGGTLTGNLQISAAQAYVDVPSTMIPSGTTQTVNWDLGNYQILDLGSASGDVAVSFSNAKAGASYVLEVIQGAVARDLTYSGMTMTWANQTPPVITTTDDAVDVLCFLAQTSTLFRGSYNQDYA